jgi:hypothetical protein
MRRSDYRVTILISIASFFFASGATAQLGTQILTETTQAVPDWLTKLPLATPAGTLAVEALVADDYTGGDFQVIATQFDPGKTYLVQAAWLHGIGCPTNAKIAIPNAEFTGIASFSTFTDLACEIADFSDSRVEGLLLAKTGPTVTNFASAVARLVGVKGQVINELGWDIRKQSVPGVTPASFSPLGSHCGAGAPRWNIETQDGRFFFLGCNSPTAPSQFASDTGWIRMRWGGAVPLLAFEVPGFALVDIRGMVIKSLSITFDEAQDASGGPDQFGAAVLDNIALNGAMRGRGPTNAN